MSEEKTNMEASCNAAGKNNEAEEKEALLKNLSKIGYKLIVLSGKGGVGKSTVAVNLAVSLAEKKFRTGLLDIDIHGPSVPIMLGLKNRGLQTTINDNKIIPVEYNEYLKVISIGFMLGREDEAVIWRGPLKYSIIKQFLKDVLWGDLDYLVIDSPPGTGDEPLSICQLVDDPKGAVVVTTPQDVALADVRKSITFCRQVKMPVIGIVENMSGFVCPHCGKTTEIFKTGGGEKMAMDMGITYLGGIPLEPQIVLNGDNGSPFLNSASGNNVAQKCFSSIVDKITAVKK
jgi:ATP-binding protein involved in chromosome partitioning